LLGSCTSIPASLLVCWWSGIHWHFQWRSRIPPMESPSSGVKFSHPHVPLLHVLHHLHYPSSPLQRPSTIWCLLRENPSFTLRYCHGRCWYQRTPFYDQCHHHARSLCYRIRRRLSLVTYVNCHGTNGTFPPDLRACRQGRPTVRFHIMLSGPGNHLHIHQLCQYGCCHLHLVQRNIVHHELSQLHHHLHHQLAHAQSFQNAKRQRLITWLCLQE